jgi:hypothetical protein
LDSRTYTAVCVSQKLAIANVGQSDLYGRPRVAEISNR